MTSKAVMRSNTKRISAVYKVHYKSRIHCSVIPYTGHLCSAQGGVWNSAVIFPPIPSAHARYTGAEAHHFDDLRFLASSFLLGHNILSKDDSSKKRTHTRTSYRPDFNHGGLIHSLTSIFATEKSSTLLLLLPAFS